MIVFICNSMITMNYKDTYTYVDYKFPKG